ncbi:MAG: hypothetical protein DRZ82_09885, partial [Thermoprotei archaeon]
MTEKIRTKITKIHIKNFLSLKDVEIELNKLNVLIGPNASGKSNIIRALELLASHAKYGIPTLPGYREFKEIAHNFDETTTITIEVEAVIGDHDVKYSLNLRADDYIEQAWIDNKIALEATGRGRARILSQRGMIEAPGGGFLRSRLLEKEVHASLLMRMPSDAIKELHILAQILKTISTYSFIPERIRARSSVSEEPRLGRHGENLARTLLHLYLEDRKAFTIIEETLKSLIPEVEEIIPHLEGTEGEIWLKIKEIKEPLRPANISDGTLRILAYITALYTGKQLVALEEPENCIHPHLLETIIDLARKSPSQVVITTHSPYLLDHIQP